MTQQPPSTVMPIEATQVSGKPNRYVRNLEQATDVDQNRNDIPVLIMAITGLFALMARRLSFDSWPLVACEIVLGIIVLGCMFGARRLGQHRILLVMSAVVLLSFPWVLNWYARRMGGGTDMTMLILSNLGWGALALMASEPSRRSTGLSVVCSGFLTLFTVFTAESQGITIAFYVWMAVCLWWLVSDHWAAVKTLQTTEIRRSGVPRVWPMLLGLGAFVVAVLSVSDSVPVLRKLRAEIAPTSGGSTDKDQAARSGVGNGDALIAAKNHATSFGPVETDFFLDSEKPSLFDVYSDEFGEPKIKKKYERAQALEQQETQINEGKFSEANRGGGNEFSVEREAPKLEEALDNLVSDSLMFWEGRTGIRLAAERWDEFDGKKWNQSTQFSDLELRQFEPRSILIEEQTWFVPKRGAVQNSLSPFVSSFPEAIRFTAYGSNRIPVPAGAQLWQIDKVTRNDFFAYTPDDCLLMTGREAVPTYTVVKLVNSQLDAEKLHQHMRTCAPGSAHVEVPSACRSSIAELAHKFGDPHERGWLQVSAIVQGLKSEFSVGQLEQQDDESAIECFLRTKRGPSYIFATAASMMLNHFEYKTRMVTGFYVNPEHFVDSESATSILPSDAHAWLEVDSGHNYWVPLEATPGYREPRIRSSLAFWLSQNWMQLTAGAVSVIAFSGAIFWVRARLFNGLLLLLGPVLSWLPRRIQVRWFRRLLDLRWTLIGQRRPASISPRKLLAGDNWGLSDVQKTSLLSFLDAYEATRFGSYRSQEQGLAAAPASAGPVLSIIRAIRAQRNQ